MMMAGTCGPVPVDCLGKSHSVVRCGHMEVFPEPKVVSHLGSVYRTRRPYRQHASLDLLRVTFLRHQTCQPDIIFSCQVQKRALSLLTRWISPLTLDFQDLE